MEALTELLFELSSDERLKILGYLREENLKLSHIAQRLGLSLPECSRHLQRLTDVLLIERDPDGAYELTPYGVLSLSLLPGLEFTSRHKEYFQTHDISYLPPEFIHRIGELTEGTLAQDMVTGIRLVDLFYKNTEEYAWMLSDQVIVNVVELVEEKVEEGVQFRAIFPEVFTPPPGYVPSIGPERRTLPSINMRLMLNEKEALVCFPERNGRVDYAPFTSSDPVFHEWCRDLYLYYWERAKPSSSILLDS